jgi:protein kinase A
MFDVFKAVNYLHELDPPIIHRDIKAENVLFYGSTLKLADFGWSNMKDRVRTTFCGTPDYLAPEMILERGHNEKLDVWTLGVLTYELIVGYAPFSPKTKFKDKKSLQKELEKNIMKNTPKYPSHVSLEAVNLIGALLNKKPKDRPTVRQALGHKWFVDNGLYFSSPLPRGKKIPLQFFPLKFFPL